MHRAAVQAYDNDKTDEFVFHSYREKTDSRQVLYLIKILLYSLISVLTSLGSQEHSVDDDLELKEKQDHRLLSVCFTDYDDTIQNKQVAFHKV